MFEERIEKKYLFRIIVLQNFEKLAWDGNSVK